MINHTNTTGCHVSSNHDWALAGLELVQNPITFVLLFVAMDSFKTSITRIRLRYRGGLTECWPAILAKKAGYVVCNTLGAGENEYFVVAVFHDLFKMLCHTVTLLELRYDFDDLRDAMISR